MIRLRSDFGATEVLVAARVAGRKRRGARGGGAPGGLCLTMEDMCPLFHPGTTRSDEQEAAENGWPLLTRVREAGSVRRAKVKSRKQREGAI